jgi:hypothetical protein
LVCLVQGRRDHHGQRGHDDQDDPLRTHRSTYDLETQRRDEGQRRDDGGNNYGGGTSREKRLANMENQLRELEHTNSV